MSQPVNRKYVMIIAGEASGDVHGARLVSAMKERNKDLLFCGIGGNALRNEGVAIIQDSSTLAVVGITEVVSKFFSIVKGLAGAKRLLKSLIPGLLILIDFPDFNLRVAAAAKKLGIPVLYYISPQVWAWRQSRVKKIKELVNRLAVILPFEEEFFKKHGVAVSYVGHPLLDGSMPPVDMNGKKNPPVVGLLPGSRDSEIDRHLPVMLEAASLIIKKAGAIKIAVSHAPSVKREYIEKIIRKNSSCDCDIISGGADRIFKVSSVVVAASGTVTLEAGIAGVPMVVIYRVSPISYLLGKTMIKVPNICLVNLIAGKTIVPELIQNEATSGRISDEVLSILCDPGKFEQMKKELAVIRDSLGGPGASGRVADIAISMLTVS
ncbi:MAG: lipid-A-disaccharide synthase [Desulfobacteraceae bacterium]|nr:MAG: lipid-A-disaccharide synthase [Desulfobacteraceae bacterium]